MMMNYLSHRSIILSRVLGTFVHRIARSQRVQDIERLESRTDTSLVSTSIVFIRSFDSNKSFEIKPHPLYATKVSEYEYLCSSAD